MSLLLCNSPCGSPVRMIAPQGFSYHENCKEAHTDTGRLKSAFVRMSGELGGLNSNVFFRVIHLHDSQVKSAKNVQFYDSSPSHLTQVLSPVNNAGTMSSHKKHSCRFAYLWKQEYDLSCSVHCLISSLSIHDHSAAIY